MTHHSSPVTHLECVLCGRQYGPAEVRYTCPACGPEGLLEVHYDWRSASERLGPEALREAPGGMARWLPILPVRSAGSLPPLRVGGTPFYAAARLGRDLGLPHLFVKDDGQNPTGSLKDRASAVCAAAALELGETLVTGASTGNAASSLSGMCASLGLETVIFVPERAPRAKVAQLLVFGATVLAVRGTYDDAFDLSLRATEEFGWYNRNTGYNPYLLEGKKTAALEIWEDLGYRVPDFVAVSVGDGCILGGLGKGFLDLKRLGLSDRMPRLVGVQAEGSSVLSKAWEAGGKLVAEPDAHTYADSICVGLPRAAGMGLKAIRESEGFFVRVSDAEIQQAQVRLARKAGVFAEPAGATPLAGLARAAAGGLIPEGATVVALVTGNGLKDVEGAMQALDRGPIPLDPDPEGLREALQGLGLAPG